MGQRSEQGGLGARGSELGAPPRPLPPERRAQPFHLPPASPSAPLTALLTLHTLPPAAPSALCRGGGGVTGLARGQLLQPSLSRAPGQPSGPPLAALTSRCRPARAPAARRPHAVSTTSRRGGSTTDAAPGRCSARLFPSGDGAAHKRPRSIVLLPDPRGPSPSGRERGEEAPGPFPPPGGGSPRRHFLPPHSQPPPRGGPPQEGWGGGGSHGKGERGKKTHTHAPPRRLDLNNCIILGFNL